MNVVLPQSVTVAMIVSYARECIESGINMYHRALHDPQEYLHSLVERANGNPKYLVNGLLPSQTFYACSDGNILGAIRVRHGSNEQVEQVIGHIGYETRPSARNQGVAKFMLQWVIQNHLSCPKLISVEADNWPSIRVIQSVAPTELSSHYDEKLGTIRRFKIEP